MTTEAGILGVLGTEVNREKTVDCSNEEDSGGCSITTTASKSENQRISQDRIAGGCKPTTSTLQRRLAKFRFAESNRVKVGENIVMHFTQEDLSILFKPCVYVFYKNRGIEEEVLYVGSGTCADRPFDRDHHLRDSLLGACRLELHACDTVKVALKLEARLCEVEPIAQQSSAKCGSPDGNRTRIPALRGQYPNR